MGARAVEKVPASFQIIWRLALDVIFAPGSAAVGPLLQTSRTVPIVFALIPDPVGSGFVNSLARPGGNVTGFSSYDYGIAAKWLETGFSGR
jgi:putative ABC transport system substrate-binding protein